MVADSYSISFWPSTTAMAKRNRDSYKGVYLIIATRQLRNVDRQTRLLQFQRL